MLSVTEWGPGGRRETLVTLPHLLATNRHFFLMQMRTPDSARLTEWDLNLGRLEPMVPSLPVGSRRGISFVWFPLWEMGLTLAVLQ